MTLLKRVLDFAMQNYGLSSNPLLQVIRPPAQDERDVRLPDEEIGRLLDECGKSQNPWLAPMVELAFEIGVRRGSFFKLRWSDTGALLSWLGCELSRLVKGGDLALLRAGGCDGARVADPDRRS